jgi:hypothetical protein
MFITQLSFAAHAQRLVCPPPPASANGSVRSLAAPAEPGVGVDTRPLWAPVTRPKNAVYEVFHGDKWLATYVARSPRAAVSRLLRHCKTPGVGAYAASLRRSDLRAQVRES